MSPGLNELIRDVAIAPGGTGDEAGKGVDVSPAMDTLAEVFDLGWSEGAGRLLVVLDEFVGDEARDACRYQFVCEREDRVAIHKREFA
jgi:hypothetical protein